jgi:hypothetical protein
MWVMARALAEVQELAAWLRELHLLALVLVPAHRP